MKQINPVALIRYYPLHREDPRQLFLPYGEDSAEE